MEERSDQARALYRDSLLAAEPIIAPLLLPIEVTNILRQRMRRGPSPLTRDAALALVDEFLSFPIELRELPDRLQHALIFADEYQLPAVYDPHYVLLARIVGCDLWTDDHRLLHTLSGRLSFVKWIGDYAAAQPD